MTELLFVGLTSECLGSESQGVKFKFDLENTHNTNQIQKEKKE